MSKTHSSHDFSGKIAEVAKKVWAAFKCVKDAPSLEQFEADFIGKNGMLSQLRKQLKDLSDHDKKSFGPEVQKLWMEVAEKVEEKKSAFAREALNAKLEADWIDVTKARSLPKGAQHPLSQVQRRVEEIFTSMGFEIGDGFEVETEWFNFDALNIPSTHPARDMQDTFWIANETDNPKENTVLRTHTSSVQVRWPLNHGVPVRVIVPGRNFRNEAVDATHDATFYQVDGIMIDKGISLAHLKGTIQTMLSQLFEREIKIRFRPGYFPFTEPGVEVDIWFEFTDKQGRPQAQWLEFMGAGMMHPNVLRNGGVDPDVYSGFAFGFGLTRLVMIKYGIDDIRLLSSQKKAFLEQF